MHLPYAYLGAQASRFVVSFHAQPGVFCVLSRGFVLSWCARIFGGGDIIAPRIIGCARHDGRTHIQGRRAGPGDFSKWLVPGISQRHLTHIQVRPSPHTTHIRGRATITRHRPGQPSNHRVGRFPRHAYSGARVPNGCRACLSVPGPSRISGGGVAHNRERNNDNPRIFGGETAHIGVRFPRISGGA